jgi:hypothetical protein
MFPHHSSRLRGLGEAPIQDSQSGTSTFDQAAQEAGPSEEVGYYVFKKALNASDNLPDLVQSIDGDSDFALVSIHGKSTGTYNINIKDHTGKPIYSSAADASNVVGTAQLPVRVRPALLYPAGGSLGISLQDTSAAPNTIELVFTGIRKFRQG